MGDNLALLRALRGVPLASCCSLCVATDAESTVGRSHILSMNTQAVVHAVLNLSKVALSVKNYQD